VIADNKLSENSQWDDTIFFDELKSLSDLDFDLRLVGIDDFEPIEFLPDLEPLVEYADVTPEDVNSARDKTEQSMRDAQTRQSQDGIEVVCPACAHHFRVIGQ